MPRIAAFLLALALTAGVSAVELGSLTLRSSYTEPLQATVPLTDLADLAPDDIQVSLADTAAYARLGIPRAQVLEQLLISVHGPGIRLRTLDAVTTGSLDIVLRVVWPSGQILRDFTLTLDAPVYGEARAQAARTFTPNPVDPDAAGVAPVPSTYTVAPTDTLWAVALATRSDATQTPQQIMLALQDLNPQAFINGNINRLRADVTLRLPSRPAIESRSEEVALAEVARQNAAFDAAATKRSQPAAVAPVASDPTPGESVAAERNDSVRSDAESDSRNPDGFLEVVTPTADSADDASPEGQSAAEIQRLQNELTLQQEANDELQRRYDQQQSRLAELEEQVALLNRLVELQNQSASDLQTLADQLQEVDGSAELEPQQAPDGAMAWSGSALRAVSQWLQVPMNAGLVVALLVVLLLLLLMVRRRQEELSADQDDLEASDALLAEDNELLESWDDDPEVVRADVDESSGAEAFAGMQGAAEGPDALDDLDLEFDPPPETTAETEDTPPGGVGADPGSEDVATRLEQAEMYMAFQSYGEAEQVLREGLAHRAGEPRLQRKLLELFAESGDRQSFEDLAHTVPEDPAVLEKLHDQLADTERELAAERAGPEASTAAEVPDLVELEDTDPDLSSDDEALLSELDDLMAEVEPDADTGPADDSEETFEVLPDDVTEVPGGDWDESFDFLDADDEMATKLDLATAYIDMGDTRGATEILQEVLDQGSDAQQADARRLLDSLD